MVPEYFDEELIIRRMIKGDIKSVKQLESVCGLSYWSNQNYLNSLDNRDYISMIAQYSNNVVGFILARLITYCDSQSESKGSEKFAEIEVYNIAVDEKYRKKGIGRRLLDSCLNRQRVNSKVVYHLEVRKSNAEAIEFYGKWDLQLKEFGKIFIITPVKMLYI